MKLRGIGLWVVGIWLCFLGPGCTTYKLEPTPGAAALSDQRSRPIPAAVGVTATEGGRSLLEDKAALELIRRLQGAGLFERVHYVASSGEGGIATVALDKRKMQKPVGSAGLFAKLFLMILSCGATAPLTTFKEEWRMDWTITVFRSGDLVKAYAASTTLHLKHRGLPTAPDSAPQVEAWQAAREQLWKQLLSEIAADREFLTSTLIGRNKPPESEVLP
jgi:hypothetical protein